MLVWQVKGLLEGIPVLEHNLVWNNVLDGDNYIIHVQVCGYGDKEKVGQERLESACRSLQSPTS